MTRRCSADHRGRLVLGARVARAAEDRLLPAPDQRASTSTRSTRSPSRPRSRTRSGPASTSSPTASCAATTTSTTSWPGSPASRSRTGQDLLLRLLRRRGHRPLPELPDRTTGRAPAWAWPTTSRSPAQLTDRPVKFSFTGPFSLSRRIRNEAYAEPGDLVRALARRLNAEARALAAAGARPAADRRAVPGRLPRAGRPGGRGDQHRHRGRAGQLGAARVLRQPLRAPVLGGPLRLPVPGVLAAQVDQLVLEFARKGHDDLRLFKQYDWDRCARPGRDRRQEPRRWRRPSWSRPGSGGRWSTCRPTA